MKYLRISLLLAAITVSAANAHAQEKWPLKRCVDYALANNISVRQSDIQARLAAVTLKQNRFGQYPSANLTSNTGYQFGRSVDRTTNTYTNQQALFQSFNLNTDVTIFNWHRIRNNILSSDLAAQAASASVDRTKNDIALTVATAFLQVLLSEEQVRIFAVSVGQSLQQLSDTRKRVEAGALPELNALTLESQLAIDSSNLVTAQGQADVNRLQLKAIMNLDFAQPFDIEVPPVETIPLQPLADLQPEIVYQMALKNQPLQRANELTYRSLIAAADAARAGLYPTFSAFGGLGTNFNGPSKYIAGQKFLGYSPVVSPLPTGYTPNIVKVNGTDYQVQSPIYSPIIRNQSFFGQWTGWGSALNNNFGQNVGIAISVPILNGYQARSTFERAKLNIKNQNLTIEQSNQKLRQDIYTAYSNAVSSMQKFNATRIGVSSSQKAYDFSKARYDLGLLSSFELITAQNNLARAKLDFANAQFDYVFKMKVLEFYKGQGLTL